VLTVPFGGSFKTVKTRWVVQTQRTFNDKSGSKPHTYNVNLDRAVYSKSNNPILYYDVNKTEPIELNIKSDGKSSNLYHTVLNDRSAEEALNKNQNNSMLLIIMVLVLIIVGIGIYSQYQLGVANDKVITLSTKLAGLIANMTKPGNVIIK
jgi:hypothetical protein